MKPLAEARLRAGIRLAAEILDSDDKRNKTVEFADVVDARFTFRSGAYVLRHCGVSVSRTSPHDAMLLAWLEKAVAKLRAAVKP